MNRWAKKGFWSKSILSDKFDPMADIKSGKTVICMEYLNFGKYITAQQALSAEHPDWQVDYIPEYRYDGICFVNFPYSSGCAVSTTSQNPERALMFYEKLLFDKTYNTLTQYGIEGKHYKMENNVYQQIGNSFPYEGMNGWSWRNPDFMPKTAASDAAEKIKKKLDVYAAKNPKYKINIEEGFNLNKNAFETQDAAVSSVSAQYLTPLTFGLVDDVEGATKTAMEKLKAAGLEVCQKNWEKQWLEYCNKKGY